ncbi:MAG: DnaB-like helicase N-terminal domain-containing protein [Sphingomonadaceae bacterium]
MRKEHATSTEPSGEGLQDVGAEAALLSAIIADNHLLEELVVNLSPNHFAEDKNAAIFHRVVQVIGEGRYTTPETLIGYCWADENLCEDHIRSVAAVKGSGDQNANVQHLARQIVLMSLRRKIVDLGNELIRSASETGNDAATVGDIAEMAKASLCHLQETHAAIAEAKLFRDASENAIGQLVRRLEAGSTQKFRGAGKSGSS